MSYDLKSFLQIQESVQRIKQITLDIQTLAEEGAPGLTDARDELETIRRNLEAVGARMIQKAMTAA